MDKLSVRERLNRLHDELRDTHRNDPATGAPLGEVLPDVKRMIDGGEADQTLPQRLEAVAVQFEAAHPKIAGSVRSIVDLLAEVGI